MNRSVTVKIKGLVPYSQSKQHTTPRNSKETWDAQETRTWRDKCSTDIDDYLVVPAMAFKQALDTAASLLGEQVPGKGKEKYVKHFMSGVLCAKHARILPKVKKQDVACVTINVNSDGTRGSGKRVWRTFPIVPEWGCEVEFSISDEAITEEIFERTFVEAGQFVGVGRFRAGKGGLYGRFAVISFEWSAGDLAAVPPVSNKGKFRIAA